MGTGHSVNFGNNGHDFNITLESGRRRASGALERPRRLNCHRNFKPLVFRQFQPGVDTPRLGRRRRPVPTQPAAQVDRLETAAITEPTRRSSVTRRRTAVTGAHRSRTKPSAIHRGA
jgi:hypothetical protein